MPVEQSGLWEQERLGLLPGKEARPQGWVWGSLEGHRQKYCHRAENREGAEGWPSMLAEQANGYLAQSLKAAFLFGSFACRANTGRLEFPLGLSPTQTGLAKTFN